MNDGEMLWKYNENHCESLSMHEQNNRDQLECTDKQWK